MLKSKLRKIQPHANKLRRRVQRYSWPEMALALFIFGSLYIVNPDFILFSFIRQCYLNTTGAIAARISETRISKALRGELHLTSIVDFSALSVQEIFSLIVTLILLLFFFNNIVLEQWTKRTRRIAQEKLVDLRLGRSKVSRLSRDAYERQKRMYTRNKVNQLLNSDEYKEKIQYVRQAFDDRRTVSNSQNSQVSAPVPSLADHDLFRPDFFDNQFDKIDRELRTERQQRQSQMNSQRSNQNGPREPIL